MLSIDYLTAEHLCVCVVLLMQPTLVHDMSTFPLTVTTLLAS